MGPLCREELVSRTADVIFCSLFLHDKMCEIMHIIKAPNPGPRPKLCPTEANIYTPVNIIYLLLLFIKSIFKLFVHIYKSNWKY